MSEQTPYRNLSSIFLKKAIITWNQPINTSNVYHVNKLSHALTLSPSYNEERNLLVLQMKTVWHL